MAEVEQSAQGPYPHLTVENSIEFVLKALNSDNNQTRLDTIIQIRNLIIGNNKYKTFFMNESLVDRLFVLLKQQSATLSNQASSYLINQITVIFASLSLGSLDTTIRLLKIHQLHDVIFNQIKYINTSKEKLSIVESSLRCLANLYTTCQLVPSLVYTLDMSLYSPTNNTNLDMLLKVYPMSNLTKKSVIQILSVSSTFLAWAFYSTKHPRLAKLHEEIERRRRLLITCDCISRFANLLTSLLEPVQLSALKFYASICFENVSALNLILSCSYYECGLLDLISAYLSRENSPELQLYAAKCLTNMCRTLQILTNSKRRMSSTKSAQSNNKSGTVSSRRASFKFKRLVRHKIDECATVKYDDVDFDNEEDYEEEDNDDDEVDEVDDIEEELREEHELDLEKTDEDEFEARTPPPQSDNDSRSEVETRLENLYRHVDVGSQLIRRKTLPTLVRLCCTYSRYYRASNMKSNNISDMVNLNGLKQQNPLLDRKETTSVQYHLNIYLLIQSINTLTYLIELNADLQTSASYLEQIIPTLAVNVLEAYSMQTINKIRLNSPANSESLRPQPSIPISSNQNRKKSTNSEEQVDSENCTEPKKKPILFDNSKNREAASLYSMFYLNYNQYCIRASQFKRHEHQYHRLVSFDPKLEQYFISSSESDEYRIGKKLNRISRSLSLLDKTVHKRLASASLHALSALAANNEENRRQITENSSMVCRLVDSIQLNKPGMEDLTDEDSTEIPLGSDEEREWEEAFKKAELSGNPEEIDKVLSGIRCSVEADFYQSDDDLINGLEEDFDDFNETDADVLRLSGLCLLHSLSRSVHQLRTKFLDRKIWMPIIELIKRSRRRRLEQKLMTMKWRLQRLTARQVMVGEGEADVEDMDEAEAAESADSEGFSAWEVDSLNEQNLLSVTTAILANLLLEFSPSKEIMEENGIIKILAELVDHKNHSIRINSMWALMNTAFQADQLVKQQIITTITMEKLFQLLTEQDDTLIMKTLGLIRNLITNRVHIDQIMSVHGTKIIQAIVMVLEGDYYSVAIKEQALCILGNVADGQAAKDFIMGNEDLLRKINSYMTYSSVELQIVAVMGVFNLVCSSDEGAIDRQTKLKEMGVHRILQRLLQHNNQILFEKAKNTLQQFALPNSVASSNR